jgi:hypothetical protein
MWKRAFLYYTCLSLSTNSDKDLFITIIRTECIVYSVSNPREESRYGAVLRVLL